MHECMDNHGHVHVASIGTPGRRKDCAIILAGWEGEYEHSGAVCQVWNCMKSSGFSRTAIMALDFGAPSFRVKTKTRQKISKPSHHLPSSPIIPYLCRPYLPRWDWKPWTISQSSRSFATCLAAWSTSEGALGSEIPPAGKPAGCSSSEHNDDFLDSLTLFGTCETCHKTHGFS